jgi:hypothetical protein
MGDHPRFPSEVAATTLGAIQGWSWPPLMALDVDHSYDFSFLFFKFERKKKKVVLENFVIYLRNNNSFYFYSNSYFCL